ncbi:MAG: hypothetical protein R3248_04050 [Candidatus Promineifilaceae bacterium]|nr:hypothetical protein [Candidatus Promineifilaceae bacterium]
MRRLTLILWLILLVVACRRSPGATPEPTETPATEAAGASEGAGESAGNNGEEAAFPDNADLRAARFAVVYHMTQIEGMTFPLVDQWTPESVSENDEFRTHTFRSGDWTLSLAAPLEDTPDLLYRVTITGPDDFFYQADMDEDGNLAPAQ